MNQSKLHVCGCLRAIIRIEGQEIDVAHCSNCSVSSEGGRPRKCVPLLNCTSGIDAQGHVYWVMVGSWKLGSILQSVSLVIHVPQSSILIMIQQRSADVKSWWRSFHVFSSLCVLLRSLLHTWSGFLRLLCQQSQDPCVPRHHRAAVEWGKPFASSLYDFLF